MDGTEYKTGNASLFATAARTEARPIYVYHYDWPNDQWNVFKRTAGREEFIRSYKLMGDAQDYCDIKNGWVR